jgi:hypothetical protein
MEAGGPYVTVPEFMDSNIVLYAYDPNDARRPKIAQQLLKKGLAGGCCVSHTGAGRSFCGTLA